jgi:hypothetical protein
MQLSAPIRLTGAGENLKPFVVARAQGGAYMTWAQRTDRGTSVYFARSTDGLAFGAPVRLSAEGMELDLGAESGPRLAADGKGGIYVVWASGLVANSSAGAASEHARHTGTGKGGGHFMRATNLAIYLATSIDDGRTFSAPRQVSDGPQGPERRFPTVAVDRNGMLAVVWLDKRLETAERPGYSHLFVARSTDGGKTFAPSVDITSGQDNSICHCCKPGLAMHPTAGMMVVYRNERNDIRDIYAVRSQDRGATWSRPAPIESFQWNLPACPMNGPSLAMDTSGNVHAVWCTGAEVDGAPLMGSADATGLKVIYRRFDAKKGAWDAPRYLTNGMHPRLALGADGTPFVTWRGEGIWLARLPAAAEAPRAQRISAENAIGAYPALAVLPNGGVLVAWQQTEGDAAQIFVATRPSQPSISRAARATPVGRSASR